MTLQDWGAIGSIIGALSVVLTLIYLSKQVRLHTEAMEEGRKLALAQTYQMRSTALQTMLVQAADSEHIAPVIMKLTALGYPKSVNALDQLSDEQRARFRLWQIAQQTHWDNLFFQHQHGYLDAESYEDSFKQRVRRLTPTWAALGLLGVRRSFRDEIARLQGQ